MSGKVSNTDSKCIPFEYVYSAFIVVKNIRDLPMTTEVINTENEWTTFKDKYLSYDFGIHSQFHTKRINFTKQSIIYYSRLDAKADTFAMAYKIDNILIKNDKLVINEKPIGNNFEVVVVNKENALHRFAVVLTIDKKYIPK